MSIELLAPAGDFDSLKAAIENGANAIYLGSKLFSARAFAKNFSLSEIKEAIDYAHLRDVRIFVTINVLYNDQDLPELIKLLDALYEYQTDALLIADIGLLKLVRHSYPDFEIHVSTQMTIHSLEAVHYFESLGVKRIVLSRENTIEEIKYICSHTSLEIEVFAHGALCVSYSGQCLMSSMIGHRSGNKGACAQPCRLPYQLEEDQTLIDDYSFLLSPKDLCTIDNIAEYIKAEVTSLKLEGRMKKPEYVAAITKAYRKAIDHLIKNTPNYNDEDIYDMKQMFNRKYTSGFPFHDQTIIDTSFSGNRGIAIGKVTGYSKMNHLVHIRLNKSLNQGDSIRFLAIDAGRPVNKMYKNGKLVSKGYPNDLIDIEFDIPVYQGQVVRTVSLETIKKLNTITKEKKYRYIDMFFEASLNKPAQLTAKTNKYCSTIQSDILIESSKNNPTSPERIKQQLSKLGGTIFGLSNIDIYIEDNLFIPITLLNNLRKKAVKDLENQILNNCIHNKKINNDIILKNYKNKENDIYVIVYQIEQLNTALSYTNNVYFYYDKNIDKAISLFKKYQTAVKFYLPHINKDNDLKKMKADIRLNDASLIVNDYGSLNLFSDHDLILGTSFNITNSLSASAFNRPFIASYEITHAIIEKISNHNKVIIPVYGKTVNMITEHCLISQHYFGKKVPHCQKCKGHQYTLIDRKKEKFDVLTDERCRNHILHNRAIYLPEIKKGNRVIILTNEDNNQTQMILDHFFSNSLKELKKFINTTSGYYKK